MTRCENCNNNLIRSDIAWLLHCPHCALEVSLLNEQEYNGKDLIGWDKTSEDFLEHLRLENAHTIFKTLQSMADLKNKTLLDIGCASGWFLRIAKLYGIQATGIEPDSYMSGKAKEHGLDIINGYFPDALDVNKNYDLISFNDVFEHLQQPNKILKECKSILTNQGLLIINLPNSTGFFYKISKLLSRAGFKKNLFRLWQKGYESPHLYYFNNNNLKGLVENNGFKLLMSGTLPSIEIKGLYQRINEDRSNSIINTWAIYIAVIASYPFIRYILPSDIIYHVYQVENNE